MLFQNVFTSLFVSDIDFLNFLPSQQMAQAGQSRAVSHKNSQKLTFELFPKSADGPRAVGSVVPRLGCPGSVVPRIRFVPLFRLSRLGCPGSVVPLGCPARHLARCRRSVVPGSVVPQLGCPAARLSRLGCPARARGEDPSAPKRKHHAPEPVH